MFLTSMILFIYNGLVYLWMVGSFPLFLMVITLASLSIFEIIPRIAPFRQFTVESRVLTLSIVILSIVWLLVYTLWDFSYVAAIVIAIIFWDNPFLGSNYAPPIHGSGGACKRPSNLRNMPG
jgi:hypothetical protein